MIPQSLDSPKYHAETGERCEVDMVWRIPRREGGDTYLMLLLEFQSTSDRWMALRVLVYASLLWQHLLNEKRLPPDGRLPPILPVVLYNGDRRWAAPLALRDLVGLPKRFAIVAMAAGNALSDSGRRCFPRG
jgi:hypothetical protein